MSADVTSTTCPLCSSGSRLATFLPGHWVCPVCQTNLVVSPEGQVIRDPFHRQRLISIQELRRQSRPIARLFRDAQPSLNLLLGLVLLTTIGSFALHRATHPNLPTPPQSTGIAGY
jgi:hypothetical protein